MRILVISAALAVATAASAQDKNSGWTWETPGVSTTTSKAATAPRSVLDRLGQPAPETPSAEEERKRRWLQRFENRGRGGDGGEGGGGDGGGAGGHG